MEETYQEREDFYDEDFNDGHIDLTDEEIESLLFDEEMSRYCNEILSN